MTHRQNARITRRNFVVFQLHVLEIVLLPYQDDFQDDFQDWLNGPNYYFLCFSWVRVVPCSYSRVKYTLVFISSRDTEWRLYDSSTSTPPVQLHAVMIPFTRTNTVTCWKWKRISDDKFWGFCSIANVEIGVIHRTDTSHSIHSWK